MDRWINDVAFREAFRTDPEQAVRAQGITLDDDEWRDLRSMDDALPDEVLQPRVSRS
jgi:hypothetical protein